MRNVRSYYGDFDFWNYYMSLGEGGRTKFIKWLSEIKLPHDSRSDAINYDFCTDYRNDVFKTGSSLVYIYANEFGIPFYVGKEDASRSDAFWEKLEDNGRDKIYAIACNIYDADALAIETLVINELSRRGWKLTNPIKAEISSEKYIDLTQSYPEVLNSINDVTRIGLESMLQEVDCLCDKTEVR